MKITVWLIVDRDDKISNVFYNFLEAENYCARFKKCKLYKAEAELSDEATWKYFAPSECLGGALTF